MAALSMQYDILGRRISRLFCWANSVVRRRSSEFALTPPPMMSDFGDELDCARWVRVRVSFVMITSMTAFWNEAAMSAFC